MSQRILCVAAVASALCVAGPASAASSNWLQFDVDAGHSGINPNETILTKANVSGLVKLYEVTLPGTVDGAPVYLSGVTTAVGAVDLLFVTTKTGQLLAINASNGSTVWSTAASAAVSCTGISGATTPFTTSSPAIDPNLQYVYSYDLTGVVRKYQVADGTEVTSGGWPQLTTRKSCVEKASAALSTATAQNGKTYLYVVHGGYPGDHGDYQGHVTAINLNDGTQNVFNANCSNLVGHFYYVTSGTSPNCAQVQSAIWARPGVIYDQVSDRILMATGNGNFDAGSGGHDWGDSIFSLAADASGTILDSYTPTSAAALNSADADLGSTAPALLPAAAGRLAVQGGKDDNLRLLDVSNFSNMGTTAQSGGEIQILALPSANRVLTQPITWQNPADNSIWAFVATGSGIDGIKITGTGRNATMAAGWSPRNSVGGTSPVLANGVLYYLTGGGLAALNPATGAAIPIPAMAGISTHWQSPIIVNGHAYFTDNSGHLWAYALDQIFDYGFEAVATD